MHQEMHLQDDCLLLDTPRLSPYIHDPFRNVQSALSGPAKADVEVNRDPEFR